jgi:exodeoxyribonuclease V alpha subunit
LEHVVYRSDDGDFVIGRLKVEGRAIPLTIKGPMPGVQTGERLRVEGRWRDDPRYGRQLLVESFLPVTPTTRAGLERYLAGGRIQGIGPVFAKRLVEHFAEDVLEVLDNAPHRLTEVPGIGPHRAEKVAEAWARSRALKSVLIFLHGLGIGAGLASRILREYGERTIATVRANPYRLATDVKGIGFRTADRIAGELGIERTSPHRLRAGLLFALVGASQEGHCYLPGPELRRRAEELLSQPWEIVRPCLRDLQQEGTIVIDGPPGDPRVWDRTVRELEVEAARRCAALAAADSPPEVDVPAALQWAEDRGGIRLTEAQREALAVALCRRFTVITGGPGTGKTTLVRALLDMWERKGLRVRLAAPTGRAARRMEETSGRRASTLHRLLEFSPRTGRFQRDRESPLQLDALVIDEASMLDLHLAAAVLEALPPSARLVLVGDVDQLPSVGPGRVLGDLIDSGVLAVVQLDRVFRQDEAGLIVQNAHALLQGRRPRSSVSPDGDFFFIERDDPEAARRTVVHLVAKRIPERWGLTPDQVQVLSPMRKGSCGTELLNQALRDELLPAAPGDPLPAPGRVGVEGRVGERVMQTRNDYDKDVFNGDMGRVEAWDPATRTLTVVFTAPERRVDYTAEERAALEPAYAVTIHKSQGSEYPAVVIPILTQHFRMLQRNLLYTAITRAKRVCVLVGSRRAVEIAVSNAEADVRWTALDERLRALPQR